MKTRNHGTVLPGSEVHPSGATNAARVAAPLVAAGEFAALAEIETLYHAKRALRRVSKSGGLCRFALLAVSPEGSGIRFQTITTDWDGDVAERLAAWVERDATLHSRLKLDIEPFAAPSDRLSGNASPDTGLVFLPVFCERARGVAIFSAPAPAPEAAGLRELHLYLIYLFARLTARIRPREATPLVPREIACLRWSAAGKTSAEIAAIIGIAENTVNSYLGSAAQKLNAVNRVQTVATAIRLGLLN